MTDKSKVQYSADDLSAVAALQEINARARISGFSVGLQLNSARMVQIERDHSRAKRRGDVSRTAELEQLLSKQKLLEEDMTNQQQREQIEPVTPKKTEAIILGRVTDQKIGAAGLRVTLHDDKGVEVASTVTDKLGAYTLRHLSTENAKLTISGSKGEVYIDQPNIKAVKPGQSSFMEFAINTKTPRSPKPPQPKDEPSKLVAVPEVKGMPLNDAQKTLKKAGLKGKKTGEIETTGPENVILGQKPVAGEFIERAADVELFVSVNKSTLMPDLAERDLKEAADIVGKLELNLGKIEVNHDPERAGKIIGQFPTAKFPITKGANAMLNVASGNPKVDLKTATFLTAFEARTAKLKLTYDGLSAALESAKITNTSELSALLKKPSKDFASALGLKDQALVKRAHKLVASVVKRFRTD